MATTELRHRPTTTPTTTTTSKPRNSGKKMAMARRGLKSLAIAISFPLALTTIVLLFTTSSSSQTHSSRPFWYPPEWAFHLATVSCSSLMGLSSWLAWAEGGFHRLLEALPLYLAQLVFGLAWGPLLFGKGSPKAALVVAVGLVGALGGCVRCFRRVNPIAADLVKPCLAWAVFLALFSYQLV
ncbi:benzodiazapine receptor protein [Dioscorea alata]|uniref:Benzodiazapine receptor protein n=1 Tax=Dioscorea alata TaxID=55571 RepID=A0ACB7VVN7_DIOAL|nr:benzodiazapine receptor protein [Dioscorea alata]